MNKITPLVEVLREHLNWRPQRLELAAHFILALSVKQTVNQHQLAECFDSSAQVSSNEKRLQRFFRDQEIDLLATTSLFPQLLGLKEPWVLCLDRTNWKLGGANLNFLVLAVAVNGVAIPLTWTLLNKQGISSMKERIALMKSFIAVFPKEQIRCLTADREFIGREWLEFLQNEGIPFCIRVREDQKLTNFKGQERSGKVLFRNTRRTHYEYWKHRKIGGLPVHLTVYKHATGELVILIHSLPSNSPDAALKLYAERWKIETLFQALKSRGFNLEDTHMTQLNRLSKLMFMITLAFVWAYRIGEWSHQQKPIPLKKHGRLSQSIFKRGLSILAHLIYVSVRKYNDYLNAVQFLSTKPKTLKLNTFY